MKVLKAACLILVFQLIPALAMAGGEGLSVPDALENKVPLDKLSGINLMFAQLYNDNLWLYATVCTVLMALLGITIAFGTDLILKAVGMEVTKIEHKE